MTMSEPIGPLDDRRALATAITVLGARVVDELPVITFSPHHTGRYRGRSPYHQRAVALLKSAVPGPRATGCQRPSSGG